MSQKAEASETKVMKMCREKMNSNQEESRPIPLSPSYSQGYSQEYSQEQEQYSQKHVSVKQRALELCGRTWVQALVVFGIVVIILVVLCPSFAARESTHDDLDQFGVDIFRVCLCGVVAAVLFFTISKYTPPSTTPVSVELVPATT